MSALQFLNKKSWHTATIRNNEKVWLKEQAAAKEQQRIDELEKQLDEERKIAEIQRLELESGRLQPDQLLKRRRLNWMYEHGPANTPEQKKKQDEKNRDDILLGKKKLQPDPQQAEPNEKVAIVDMEAKLREDPMFQVELHRVQMQQMQRKQPNPGPAATAPSHIREIIDAKRARKEDRRRVREERRLKREERKLRKRHRSIIHQDTSHVSPGGNVRQEDPELSRDGQVPEYPDVAKFGLRIPEGGSGVQVTTEFVPRKSEKVRRSRWDVRPSMQSAGDVSGDDGQRKGKTSSGRPPLSPTLRARAEEKRRQLQEMKNNALRLDTERRMRAEKHVKDANREREELDDRGRRRKSRLSVSEQEPAVLFARQTIARGASASDRIRQRRAWSAESGNACY